MATSSLLPTEADLTPHLIGSFTFCFRQTIIYHQIPDKLLDKLAIEVAETGLKLKKCSETISAVALEMPVLSYGATAFDGSLLFFHGHSYVSAVYHAIKSRHIIRSIGCFQVNLYQKGITNK